jgi:exopolysaccharide biosynthesis polyprenyl glycosylphosphotransferase
MNRKQNFERRALQFILLAIDAGVIAIAFTLALLVRFVAMSLDEALRGFVLTGRFVGFFVLFAFCFYLFDLYEPRGWRTKLFSPLKTALATALASVLMFSWFYFFAAQAAGVFGRGVLLGSVLIIYAGALLSRWAISKIESDRLGQQSWLFLGDRPTFEMLLKDVARIKAFDSMVYENFEVDPVRLAERLRSPWTGVIIGGALPARLNSTLMSARLKGQGILSLQGFYEFYCGKIPLHSLDDAWFAFSEGFSILHSPFSVRLKRLADIFIALTLLILLSPVLLITALLIRLESRGPALYRQIRLGLDNRPFSMHKLRSMRTDAEKSTGAKWADKNDSRVTRIGRFIRKVRLDELPQLWNILVGEMSFVGPRPERPEFTQKLREKIPFYDLRHLVKPGLTGWAQVMYPYGASDEDAREKLQYELFYIKNYSFELDIKIVLKTVSVVLFGAGR